MNSVLNNSPHPESGSVRSCDQIFRCNQLRGHKKLPTIKRTILSVFFCNTVALNFIYTISATIIVIEHIYMYIYKKPLVNLHFC